MLTNVKNVKNSQYYTEVINEVKDRCSARDEEYTFDVAKTRQKFKRCVNVCRTAAMKVKTASGIKRFQEDKDLGSWFGKLLPVVSSMDNCQPEQAIEPGSMETHTPPSRDEEITDDEDYNEDTPTSGQRSTAESDEAGRPSSKKRRRNSYIPTPSTTKVLKPETILGEIKETVSSLKSLASDTSSKDILDFLKEESKRQAERDTAFLQLLSNLIPQPNLQPPNQSQSMPPHSSNQQFGFLQTRNRTDSFNQQSNFSSPYPPFAHSPATSAPPAEMRNQFRYGMSNMRASSTIRPPTTSSDTGESHETFTQQLMDPNFP